MSIAAPMPSTTDGHVLLTDAERRRLAGAPRLWAGLSHPVQKKTFSRGADVLGESIVGFFRRVRARRLDVSRADRIIDQAARLRNHSEQALDDTISLAKERASAHAPGVGDIDGAFSVGYEVVRRETGLSLHPVQVLASLAIADGCCAELATGEGKTVSAILPAALWAWRGRGVHVITVNDYLARRDAETTRNSYRRLGLRVGIIQEASTQRERRDAYDADITYAADKQVIFDHLRDRLLSPMLPRLSGAILDDMFGPESSRDYPPDWSSRIVQRGLYAAIVDEADSILIDEAVTPAIISGSIETSAGKGEPTYFTLAASIVRSWTPGVEYTVEHRRRRVSLTEKGRQVLAERSRDLPAFWTGPRRREELIVQALQAKELYLIGQEYIIRDGKILIVDRSTGRILPGRQWSLGVHQAVEAKEGLELTEERRTTARVSYQGFFQRYNLLAGMSGTAWEVRGEMWRWYDLPVVRIPTHKPVIRTRLPDRSFQKESEKFDAITSRVIELREQGRPVLVGTRSVASSERLGAALLARGIGCNILNATREAEEAAIIERAGESGAVTVATNMAGRGTDIRLDGKAREAGGLAVISTERNDEERVDRQLAGRAGRQGDPGSFEAFVSLEDQLIAQHGFKPLTWLVRRLGWKVLLAALWRLAQASASRRWSLMRAEAAKADAWFEMAVGRVSR